MLLLTTLFPAFLSLVFLEILFFRNFSWQFLKYIILFLIGGACIYTGNMHLIIIGMYMIALGSLWVFFIHRIRRNG